MKRSLFIPLPLPSLDFNTVAIADITSSRTLNRSVDGAIKDVVMMPTMSVNGRRQL